MNQEGFPKRISTNLFSGIWSLNTAVKSEEIAIAVSDKIEDSEENKRWFFREIDTINKVFNKGIPMDDHVAMKYYEAMKGFRKDYLSEAMTQVTHGHSLPTIKDYVDAYNTVRSRKFMQDHKRLPAYVPATQEENIRIVVMSAMHLHYNHHWPIESMPMEAIKKAFKKMYPDDEFDFDKFKAKITPAVVENYLKLQDNKVLG